jgi:hypothetical protein
MYLRGPQLSSAVFDEVRNALVSQTPSRQHRLAGLPRDNSSFQISSQRMDGVCTTSGTLPGTPVRAMLQIDDSHRRAGISPVRGFTLLISQAIERQTKPRV